MYKCHMGAHYDVIIQSFHKKRSTDGQTRAQAAKQIKTSNSYKIQKNPSAVQ